MKRVLFISNTANFSKFNRPFMKWFKEQGWQVDYCSSGEETVFDCDNQYTVNIQRSPFSLKNIKGYFEVKKILSENKYDIIHCHTPMGGVIGRLASRKLRKQKKIKVIYTAHGFHFYKGAPVKNWLLYYTMEKQLAHYTDVIVTINNEDFQNAKKMNKKWIVYKIDGVGVDLTKFYSNKTLTDRLHLRKEKGYRNEDFIILYTAEFIPRKNHKLLFSILPSLKKQIPELKIILCGKGELLEEFKMLALQNKMDYIDFTGYTKDVANYCRISDILVMPSLQEGLPIAMIEGISTGLPVVASNIRGHCDVIEDGINGFLFSLKSPRDFEEKINILYRDKELLQTMGKRNIEISEKYSVNIIISKMADIYKSLF